MRNLHPEAVKNESIFFEPAGNDPAPTNDDLEKARLEYEIAKNNAKAPAVRRAHPAALNALAENAKRKLESIESALQVTGKAPQKLDDYSEKFPVEKYPIAEVREAFIETEKATEAHLSAMKAKWEVLKKYNLPEDWRG